MPAHHILARAAARALAACMVALAAPVVQANSADAVQNSALDSQLFYQLLIGEIELRAGAAGTAYEVVLDAARRTRDEQLFRRATDIALQARAGDQALAAVKAWRLALPESMDAHRYLVQLLVALNRAEESVEPLRSLLALTPLAERSGMIEALPRFFARSNERLQSAQLVEKVLQGHLEAPATRIAAHVALGRAWLAVPDAARAADLARRAQAFDTAADAPAQLAIETLPGRPESEAVVLAHLQARPRSTGVRLMYARMLTTAQRYTEAIEQLETLTAAEPTLAPPLLTLGALHLELRHAAQATAVLERYVELVRKNGPGTDEDDEEQAGTPAERALIQAHLMLAQAAEQRKDYKAAEAWLQRIDSPQRALEVQTRRATLLARQGRLADGRALIRAVPERGGVDERGKLLAEAQLLRDMKAWGEANAVLAQANRKFADDADILYEQSMTAEKLSRLDEMERLLRRVIEIKPDHHHAYNALGYSLADRGVRLDEARTLIRKALELSPGEPFITDSLGWVEYRLGNREEALRLLRSAYQARPDPEIGAHLGEVLWSAGQRDEARRIWREGRQRDADNEVLRETLARLKVDL